MKTWLPSQHYHTRGHTGTPTSKCAPLIFVHWRCQKMYFRNTTVKLDNLLSLVTKHYIYASKTSYCEGKFNSWQFSPSWQWNPAVLYSFTQALVLICFNVSKTLQSSVWISLYQNKRLLIRRKQLSNWETTLVFISFGAHIITRCLLPLWCDTTTSMELIWEMALWGLELARINSMHSVTGMPHYGDLTVTWIVIVLNTC